MSPRFLCVTPAVQGLPLSCFVSELDLVCVECLPMIKPMVVVFNLLEVDFTLSGGCMIGEH